VISNVTVLVTCFDPTSGAYWADDPAGPMDGTPALPLLRGEQSRRPFAGKSN
jgi:hypothetical protein